MSDGFNLADIHLEGCLDQPLAVAGDSGFTDDRTVGQLVINILHNLNGLIKRASLVAAIVVIQKLTLTADEYGLGGGRADVDAQKARAGVGFKASPLHTVLLVA